MKTVKITFRKGGVLTYQSSKTVEEIRNLFSNGCNSILGISFS